MQCRDQYFIMISTFINDRLNNKKETKNSIGRLSYWLLLRGTISFQAPGGETRNRHYPRNIFTSVQYFLLSGISWEISQWNAYCCRCWVARSDDLQRPKVYTENPRYAWGTHATDLFRNGWSLSFGTCTFLRVACLRLSVSLSALRVWFC